LVQRLLALLAEESAAGAAIVDVAVRRLEAGDDAACWAAKCRLSEGVNVSASSAHQVHGAIGFTDEHELRHFTRRLWAWRDEYGTESYAADQLGRRAQASGVSVWAFLTAHL
jgi:acyl-CoA dehydrogenase